jgi:hypothetical protein
MWNCSSWIGTDQPKVHPTSLIIWPLSMKFNQNPLRGRGGKMWWHALHSDCAFTLRTSYKDKKQSKISNFHSLHSPGSCTIRCLELNINLLSEHDHCSGSMKISELGKLIPPFVLETWEPFSILFCPTVLSIGNESLRDHVVKRKFIAVIFSCCDAYIAEM